MWPKAVSWPQPECLRTTLCSLRTWRPWLEWSCQGDAGQVGQNYTHMFKGCMSVSPVDIYTLPLTPRDPSDTRSYPEQDKQPHRFTEFHVLQQRCIYCVLLSLTQSGKNLLHSKDVITFFLNDTVGRLRTAGVQWTKWVHKLKQVDAEMYWTCCGLLKACRIFHHLTPFRFAVFGSSCAAQFPLNMEKSVYVILNCRAEAKICKLQTTCIHYLDLFV